MYKLRRLLLHNHTKAACLLIAAFFAFKTFQQTANRTANANEPQNQRSSEPLPSDSKTIRFNEPLLEQSLTREKSDTNPPIVDSLRLREILIESEKQTDIQYADFLASLVGYSDERLDSIRQTLSESEAELRTMLLSLDYASPQIKENLNSRIASIQAQKIKRLAVSMSSQDMDRLDNYVASLGFREKLPDLRKQMKARRLQLSEDKAAKIALRYEKAIEKQRAIMQGRNKKNNDPNASTPSFDHLFLEEIAYILEDDSFSAFSDLYLDSQYE